MKKRSKKLFDIGALCHEQIQYKTKSFLVLFFKKELLPSLACLALFVTVALGQTAPPAGAVPAKIEEVRKTRAESLLGQPVMDAIGDVFGNVVDVLIDADGTPHAAVIDFTGFFGIGNRRVAVAWTALQFTVAQDHIAIHVPMDIPKLKAMPEYKQGAASVPVATPAAPAAPARPH